METKDSLSPIGKYIMLSALGNSMLPTICSGDTLIIDVSEVCYDINDIVVYYSNESNGLKLIAHRVTHIFGNKILITKGDNNTIANNPIRINRIIGKVIEVRRKTE